MDMIYKDDTLFVDMMGNVGIGEIIKLKNRLFSVLDQYGVNNVVINVKNVFTLNKYQMNMLIKEYHRKYNGKLIINTK